jgi:hypothetical protein
LGIDLAAHHNDEKTAETFRDLHLETSKQTIKLLLYGTFLLLEIISGYHKRFMNAERHNSRIRRRVFTTRPMTARSSSRLDGECRITRPRIRMGIARMENIPKLRTTILHS